MSNKMLRPGTMQNKFSELKRFLSFFATCTKAFKRSRKKPVYSKSIQDLNFRLGIQTSVQIYQLILIPKITKISALPSKLGFPRDETSRCPFVPGQKKILSQCPFVPGQGQEQMSRDKLLCPGTSRDKMK